MWEYSQRESLGLPLLPIQRPLTHNDNVRSESRGKSGLESDGRRVARTSAVVDSAIADKEMRGVRARMREVGASGKVAAAAAAAAVAAEAGEGALSVSTSGRAATFPTSDSSMRSAALSLSLGEQGGLACRHRSPAGSQSCHEPLGVGQRSAAMIMPSVSVRTSSVIAPFTSRLRTTLIAPVVPRQRSVRRGWFKRMHLNCDGQLTGSQQEEDRKPGTPRISLSSAQVSSTILPS
jgi:hypothetical protein